ncbi:hypothetical protein [Nonomuraea rhodomycinica]|uniref:Uncharacterized protein n=1 Tax=Nonomuraea rhodomycinica TaxID=1712872 RepID=A0A7Y6MF71_9ACTN|nr:hypothetical protein [Nonomuraea rhodomycinica]NUW44464.1 hypothetical protein [Nonomuraea rhodomycinica]
MTELITRLGERMISAFVPQEKAEAVGGCKTYACWICTKDGCKQYATYAWDPVHGTYCWRCPV